MASVRARDIPAGMGLLLAVLVLACTEDTPTTASPAPGATGTATPHATTRALSATPLPSPTASPTPEFSLILPDLTTTASDDVYISVNFNGVRLLHFSTEVHNIGAGAMQIIGPDPEEGAEATTAWQVIETRSAGQLERLVGFLQVNEEHGHWHLDTFAIYELWTQLDEGGLGDLVTSSGKVTFCLIDEFPLDPEASDFLPQFGPCDPNAQGISSGWGETYEAWLPGQMLDITDLPDGNYALRTILDPDDLLLESDETNNEHVMLLTIEGEDVTPTLELAEDAPASDNAGA